MVAALLRIPQEAPQQCKDQDSGEQHSHFLSPQSIQNGIAAEHGDESGAKMADQPHDNGQEHIPGEGLHKANQQGHDLKAGLFHPFVPPFV